jgi:hypothetical protein
MKHIHSATLEAAGGRNGGYKQHVPEVCAISYTQRQLIALQATFIHCGERRTRRLLKSNTEYAPVIDGDANVFDQTFFRAGERGGYAAGQVLAKGIADYLGSLNELGAVTRISFWVIFSQIAYGL